MPAGSKMDPPLAKAKPISNSDTKVSEEGEGGGAPRTGVEIPLQPMEVNGGADIHLQPMEDLTPEQVDVLKQDCDPMEISCWSKLLAGPVTPWREEPTLE
ncbi:AN1-type zinc finger protein 5-like [Grus japonensis]|uniref:AN1-type zinc finger protein 5-like n=1 Tax=Grus japonensis TaxID=30415 RepID=A0ABC9YAE5_GRUJA